MWPPTSPTSSSRMLSKVSSTVDLKNCYWSLQLPPLVRGEFVLSTSCNGHFCSYGLRCLPFGWSYSAYLANETLLQLLQPALRLIPTLWLYIDDVLVAHADPHFLMYVSNLIQHTLLTAGLLLSPKSQPYPVSSITWLGKLISVRHGILNLTSHLSALFLAIWRLRTVRSSPRSILRILGSIQWLATPFSLLGPLLAPLYQYLHHSSYAERLPLRTWAFLLTAFFHVFLPVLPRKTPPPCTMPIFYTDAAPYKERFLVSALRQSTFATSVQCPQWIWNQQLAELYGAFHTLRQAALRGFTYICLVTDNAAVYYSLASFRVSSYAYTRARILRRILRLCLHSNLRIQLVLVPSLFNAADSFTRPDTTSVTSKLQYPPTMDRSYKYTAVIPSLWYRQPK
jgi:hypothetical protein